MSESVSPVAIRVVRPYLTEDELLEQELETFTRASIVFYGAEPRPQGLVLRFELALASGQTVVRGEGRVLGYRADAQGGQGALTVRFTRLDSRSKIFLDRAAVLRDKRRPSLAPAVTQQPPSFTPVAVSDGPPPPPARALEAPRVPSIPPLPRLPSTDRVHDREALLDRLRTRSKSLDPAAMLRLLERGR